MRTKEETLEQLKSTVSFMSEAQSDNERRRIAGYMEGLLHVLDPEFLEGNFVYKTETRRTLFRSKTKQIVVESYPGLMTRLAETYLSRVNKK